MDGISGKAIYSPENRYKYNGIELNSDLDLYSYEARYRNLDPQIGRWSQVDPKTEKMEMWSPYASNYNNPIKFNDFLGDEPGPDDPIVQYGIFTGRKYSMTRPQGIASALKLGAEYVGNTLMEGMEAINRNLNPLVPAAEVVVGKSYETGFTEDKSRVASGVEVAAVFIPGGKAEISAAKALERSVISLDNNALIHAVEKGGGDAVKAAIGGDKPIVSITAAKEFLAKGDKNALRTFMQEIGATISGKGASSGQVKSLQEAATSIGRKLGINDASIIGGAINNKASVLTNDKRMINFMNALGLPVKSF